MEPRDRQFIGRQALEAVLTAEQDTHSPSRKLVGLLLEDRGVLRSHQKVLMDGGDASANQGRGADQRDGIAPRQDADQGGTCGEITSGTFSPTLERSIAFARVPAAVGRHVRVDVRGKLLNARVVKPPFVRFGKAMIELSEKT
jgi:aminomethyltransferase